MDRLAALEANLAQLALAAPQCLLLEGGTEQGRLNLATYWAMTANCPQALASQATGEAARPCGECQTCRQITANEHADLLIYDGRIANKTDEEKPGPIRALRMENMRELKSLAGTAPHGPGKRIAIFQGLTLAREEAMNSLLKTLEEPSAHTRFVLLTPQRAQLLPTLVSRSFCMTLPWTGSDGQAGKWDGELADFLTGDAGFLDRVAGRTALDAQEAGEILLACQRSLVRCLGGKKTTALDKILAPLAAEPRKSALAGDWLTEAQEMLACAVNPGRVIEAFCSRLYILNKRC